MSPLIRAKESAELVEPACGLVVDDDLVEWDYGDAEGLTTPEMRSETPGWSVWTHPMEGGETVAAVGARADAFLGRVLTEVPEGNVAVFSHGHLLAVMIARWCGLAPVEGRRFALRHGEPARFAPRGTSGRSTTARGWCSTRRPAPDGAHSANPVNPSTRHPCG